MTDQPASSQPDPSSPDPSGPDPPTTSGVEEDQGAALDRAAASIREARDAEGSVAANDDITSRDDERAGVHSEDPDGEGGHP